MFETPIEVTNAIELVAKRLNKEGIEFVFAGSVSSFIQGCEITPGDIDILVADDVDVQRAVLAFNEFLTDEIGPIEDDNWVSTKNVPFKRFADYADNSWTFSRLLLNGVKLEFANIRPIIEKEYIDGSGFWENGPYVWQQIIKVTYKDLELPVIPLEIQLETNMNRNLEARVKEITKVFQKRGYNEKLINYALSEENRLKFNDML